MSTSHLWALIEEWRDAQLFPVSQAALADKVGITRSAMSQWKKGQATPTPENLRTLSRVTRIPYDRLLEAVVRDMGYMTDEEVGRHGDAAPITPAGGSPAAEGATVHEFPGSGRFNEPVSGEGATVPDKAVAHEGGHYDEEVEAFQEEP